MKTSTFLKQSLFLGQKSSRFALVFATLILTYLSGLSQPVITSNLPIVIINTNGQTIPNEPKIAATMKIVGKSVVAGSPDSVYYYSASSNANVYQYSGNIGIEIRGNTSTYWPKKSYGFETREAATDADSNVVLLGMPKEADWVLNACFGDKSFLREVLSQEMFRKTNRYAPRTRYVELYLNVDGQPLYQGVYILMEKIKRNDNRVKIKKLEEVDTDAAKITGGYILQVGENEEKKWSSHIPPNDVPLQAPPIFHVEYPKLHEYTNSTSLNLQFNYIKQYMYNFETALNGPDFKSPTLGYRPYLNVDSFVDFFLLQEFTKNSDAWRVSTFLYKDRDSEGGRFTLGPPWDFDKSMGNQQFCYPRSVKPDSSWAWQFNIYCPGRTSSTPFWAKKVLEDCYFVQKLVTRYRELRKGPWHLDSIHHFIDTQRTLLKAKDAITRNFTKWDILEDPIMYNEYYPLPGNTFDKEVDYLKTWLTAHLAWMDANIEAVGPLTQPTLTSANCTPGVITSVYSLLSECALPTNQPTTYQAPAYIQLNPGFSVQGQASFVAKIVACPTN